MKTINDLQTYQQIIQYLKDKKAKDNRNINLLFGNGFSIAYDSKIFSYNALSQYISESTNPTIAKLFNKLKTQNFELVMRQLDGFCDIAHLFSTDKNLVPNIQKTTNDLKTCLIEAIKTSHPEHVFQMHEKQSNSCMKFLEDFLNNDGYIFSTNYDLLLYWVLMRNKVKNVVDGFGRDIIINQENYSEEPEFTELRWGKHKEDQSIFYLHGSLLLFDTGTQIAKVEYNTKNYILDIIKSKIDAKEYPVFVTAGNGEQKLAQISHNKYLNYCYEKLSTIGGSLVTFGFNFGEYDNHIIKAINKATKYRGKEHKPLWSVYIGVYSDEDLNHINKLIENKAFDSKVTPYNAQTVNPWNMQ